MLLTEDPQELSPVIGRGGIIAYPTEAVFGLGCRPGDPVACERLLTLKGRDMGKGLIVITDDLSRIAFWLNPVPEIAQARAEATWPGPHTWLWPSRPGCPAWLTGSRNRLAVRVSAHPLVRQLCQSAGTALVSTSANMSQEEPCRDADCVQRHFGDRIDGILKGECAGASAPSTIRDLITGEWIRGGPST